MNTNDKHHRNTQLCRKIDRFILPLLIILYLFAFLDRSSIGNAKVAGMDTSLGLKSSEFNWGLSVFFVGYVMWQVPSNFLLKNWGASKLLPLITIIWAVITICLSFVKTGPQLILVRFLLGVAEAGLFPGILYYLTLWYTKTELALRISIFFGAATLASAFSGLFAASLVLLDSKLGLHGWQWIFIVEGSATVVIGIVSIFALPDGPGNAWFLTAEERKIGKARVETDTNSNPVTISDVVAVLTDWKTWFFSLVFFSGGIAFHSTALFLPSIVNGLGFSKLTSQLCSAPPYFLSFICLTLNGLHSDRTCERGYHAAFPLFCGAVGYLGLLVFQDIVLEYCAICFTVGLMIANIPITLSWASNNFTDSSRRAIALAFINCLGNVGGFIAGQIYQDSDRPRYVRGHTTCAILCLFGAVSAVLLRRTFQVLNQRQDRLAVSGKNHHLPRYIL